MGNEAKDERFIEEGNQLTRRRARIMKSEPVRMPFASYEVASCGPRNVDANGSEVESC